MHTICVINQFSIQMSLVNEHTCIIKMCALLEYRKIGTADYAGIIMSIIGL